MIHNILGVLVKIMPYNNVQATLSERTFEGMLIVDVILFGKPRVWFYIYPHGEVVHVDSYIGSCPLLLVNGQNQIPSNPIALEKGTRVYVLEFKLFPSGMATAELRSE